MHEHKIGNFSKSEIQGLVSRYRLVAKELSMLTKSFPEQKSLANPHYWYVRIPAVSSFADSLEIPASIRRLCIQALIDRVQHLIELKPASRSSARIVAEINLPKLSDSGIIVFFDEAYFIELFSRNLGELGWKPLPPYISLEKEWVLSIPDKLSMKGYREEVKDRGILYTREIWFVGELD